MSAGADNRMRTLWRAERLDYSNPFRITQRVHTTRAVMCSQPHPVRTADRTVRNSARLNSQRGDWLSAIPSML